MKYGSVEFTFAEPFANALAADASFRSWVLKRTRFAAIGEGCTLLAEEMLAARTKAAGSWWRSHYTEACRCEGCRGQESDIFAVFQSLAGRRFGLHVEVKQPRDRFPKNKDQAANYRLRADCWARSPPKRVLAHEEADTLLLCSRSKLTDYAPHIPKFGGVITFEELQQAFPGATRAASAPSA